MNRPLACLVIAAVSFVGLSAREQGEVRSFTITGQDHAFSPAEIVVKKDDLVKVTFRAADMPHSFTNEKYRISKRAGAGQTVTFEFRADQPGRERVLLQPHRRRALPQHEGPPDRQVTRAARSSAAPGAHNRYAVLSRLFLCP